ncbi:Cro/CI family transcriptional regulator [Aliamphritea hakodatensis]|uniref:Cro/CI family transcriptional regulator n=1 Tax=Aliamphritea hakodatensis TaxID=2895352 RepID=UPI0022FD4F6F|nr:Cro/CI family transcriptional regulator [Aliamphritea hakodatensis]
MARMNTTTDLKACASAVIEKLGGPSAIASTLDILPWAVSKWRKSKIPAERVPVLVQQFSGKVTANEMRPDLYPKDSG